MVVLKENSKIINKISKKDNHIQLFSYSLLLFERFCKETSLNWGNIMCIRRCSKRQQDLLRLNCETQAGNISYIGTSSSSFFFASSLLLTLVLFYLFSSRWCDIDAPFSTARFYCTLVTSQLLFIFFLFNLSHSALLQWFSYIKVCCFEFLPELIEF